ncbi:MAG TPA: helix-turn-helix domain-containing protein [Candidatus Elarobacter sp.]|jgi:DNA-binding HxlR family transcriptional regulator|nr:helix-turn-helix domain-containing protein [Candidatus Elarobacter sp.]
MSDVSSHRDVRYPPGGKGYPIALAAVGVNEALAVISGRWKSEILFALFDKRVLRFSELERAVGGITQKVLTQQLRELEHDGMVARTVHAAVPPRVEYRLTEIGDAICPALDALLQWVQLRRDALGDEDCQS